MSRAVAGCVHYHGAQIRTEGLHRLSAFELGAAIPRLMLLRIHECRSGRRRRISSSTKPPIATRAAKKPRLNRQNVRWPEPHWLVLGRNQRNASQLPRSPDRRRQGVPHWNRKSTVESGGRLLRACHQPRRAAAPITIATIACTIFITHPAELVCGRRVGSGVRYRRDSIKPISPPTPVSSKAWTARTSPRRRNCPETDRLAKEDISPFSRRTFDQSLGRTFAQTD